MSGRIFDINDPEPEDVTRVVEVDEDGNVQWSDSENGYSNTWSKTNNGRGWKGYKEGGKDYRDWADLVRRFGPVRELP